SVRCWHRAKPACNPNGRASDLILLLPQSDLSAGATVSRASRTAKWSSPENTSCTVLPSALNHLVGKLAVSPGRTSRFSVKYTVVHGPASSSCPAALHLAARSWVRLAKAGKMGGGGTPLCAQVSRLALGRRPSAMPPCPWVAAPVVPTAPWEVSRLPPPAHRRPSPTDPFPPPHRVAFHTKTYSYR